MLLSIEQTQYLLRVIDKNQLVIIGSELGTEFLTEYDKTVLRNFGIDPDKIYIPELSAIDTSFHFGMLAEALGAIEAHKLTYSELRSYIRRGEYLPVPERQKETLKSIKMQSFSSLKSMGGNIFADVNNILTDKSRLGQQQFIADELKEGMKNYQTVSQIAHEIAHKTGDWGRNFDRIIETASQAALEQGKVAEILRRTEGKDARVYKLTQSGCCKHCLRLYRTKGEGSQPIIFQLSELIGNGSNIGRKTEDWKATVDPVHPHCRCPLFEYKEGYLWNTKTGRFDIVDPEYKIKTAAKRKLIRVVIEGKTHYL